MPLKKPNMLWLFIPVSAIFYCCQHTSSEKLKIHYPEEILQKFSKIYNQQKSRDTLIYLVDSLYKTFPSVSVADKYRYFDFKRNLHEAFRYNKRGYDTAIFYLDSMIAIIENNGLQKQMKKEYTKAFSMRGEYFMRIERYSDAVQDINTCKQLNLEAGDSCLMGENTKTLSTIAIRQSNYILAAGLMKEALVLISYCKNDEGQFIRLQRYLDDLGFIYASINEYDSSLLYHFAAMNYVYENKRLMGKDTLFPYVALENIYGNIGVTKLKQKNFSEAEIYFKKSLAISENILNNPVNVAQMHYLLGYIYIKNGRIKEASEMASRSARQIDKLETGFKRDLFQLQADIAHAEMKFEAENDYLQQLLLIKDTLYLRKIELLNNNPLTEYERLDKKYQVELLEKDNRNERNKTKAAISIGILLILLAGISFYLLWRLRTVMKKRAVVYNKLVMSERELKEIMVQKEMAENALREKELFAQEMRLQMEFNEAIIQQRRQISDDMHDELSSSLAALKFYVGDIKKRPSNKDSEALMEIEAEVNTIYNSAREYMHSLKTNNWETKFSLTGFLKEIQQKFSEKGLMTVSLDIDENNIKDKLSIQQHDQLYHIVKEAISNVIKHAGASELLVAITFKDDKCIFSIADNGKGFDKNQVVHGIGTQSLQKRIKNINGELSIDSSETGVIINGFFPVY